MILRAVGKFIIKYNIIVELSLEDILKCISEPKALIYLNLEINFLNFLNLSFVRHFVDNFALFICDIYALVHMHVLTSLIHISSNNKIKYQQQHLLPNVLDPCG